MASMKRSRRDLTTSFGCIGAALPFENLVSRVALDRSEALFLDDAAQECFGRFVPRARSGDDVLLDHDRAEVVRAAVQSAPSDFDALRQPRDLMVRDVVEEEAPDGKP